MNDASFQIERVLGAGGHGTVYRALMRSPNGLERAVALKMLRAERTGEGDVARLRDEARLLARVKHRAIIGVLDLVRLEAGWAVIMELADGLDLSTLLSYLTVPPRAAVQIVGEIASALHAMWTVEEAGRPLRLVHRDLKPANLVVTPNGEVKILDFGLATSRFINREAVTATDVVVGTLRYMSPERFEGVVDGPGDVYSLGVLLLDMLRIDLGVSGFSTKEDLEKRMAPALAAAERVAGAEVAELIGRLLAHDPVVRPTALELARQSRWLAPRVEGPDLADWALEEVQTLIDELTERLGEDPLVGATVTTEMPRPPARTPWELLLGAGVFAAVLAGATFVAGGLAGGGALWLGTTQAARPELVSVTPLAGLPEGARPRTVSADGRQVAYALDGALWRLELTSSPVKLAVPQEDVRSAMISPDGARIAYRAGEGVFVVEPPAAPRLVAANGLLEAWHPDGERLLVTVRQGDEAIENDSGEVWVVDVTSGAREVLPGDRLAIPRWVGATDAVVATTPDGLVQIHGDRVTRVGEPLNAFTVTSDGTTLVAADFDGVRSRLLSGRLGGDLSADTTLDAMVPFLGPPSGDRVVLAQLRIDARVRRIALDPRAGRATGERLLPLPRELTNAVLLPDGAHISMAVPRADVQPGQPKVSGEERLTVVDLDGKVTQQLGVLVTKGAADAGFSADGRTTWVEMPDEGGLHAVLAVPLDRAEAARRIARFDPQEIAQLQVDPSGERAAVTDVDGRVHVVPLADPLVVDGPIGLEGWDVRAWTRDGRLLVTNATDTLAVATPGSAPRPLVEGVRQVWPAGPGHALLDRGDGVDVYELATGRLWRAASVAPDVDGVNASMTPDLTGMIVVEWRDHEETWVARYE